MSLSAPAADGSASGHIVSQARSLRAADAHCDDSVPSIQGPVATLEEIVAALLSGVSNPKRQRVLELLQAPTQEPGPIALVANLCGSSTPGWPAALDISTDFSSGSNSLVRTRKE